MTCFVLRERLSLQKWHSVGRVLPNARAKRQTHALKDRTHDLTRNARTKPDRALYPMRLPVGYLCRKYTALTVKLLKVELAPLCMSWGIMIQFLPNDLFPS